MIKTAIIKRLKNGKYRLYSRKKDTKTHKRKNLGTFDSLSAAKKHEKAVWFFKGHGADDGKSDDKETQMLSDLSDIANYLEESGFIDRANKIYDAMECIDGSFNEDYSMDQYIPDAQSNSENEGFIGGSGVGGSYSTFNAPEAQPADDAEMLEILDDLPKKPPIAKRQLQNEDVAARSNGLEGNSFTDNRNVGMFGGFGDPGLLQEYENLEGAYGPDRK